MARVSGPDPVMGYAHFFEKENADVHFFDDQDYNIITFEGHPYNAHQVSCPTYRPNTEATKCGAEVAELKNVSGKSYCCSGSQKPAPAPPLKCTTGCGVPCHFPFTYSGRSYNKCTTDGGDPAPWCATNSKYDGTHYGYCYGCPKDVHMNQTTSDVIV